MSPNITNIQTSPNTSREQLQAVPDRIENLLTEKQFTRAVDILSEALRVLKQREFGDIGALQDVFTYLKNQESVLLPIS